MPDHPAAQSWFSVSGQDIAWTLLIIGLSVFCCTMFKRFVLLFRGKPDPRFGDIGKRLSLLARDGFLQFRQLRYRPAGFLHMAIFWGFLVLSLHSLDLIVGGLRAGRGFSFLSGDFGLAYLFFKEVFTLIVACACIGAIYHRAIKNPTRYRDSRKAEAYAVLFLILVLMMTDMAYEGSKPALGQGEPGFLPAAQLFAWLFSDISQNAAVAVNHFAYWMHLIVFFLFLNLLPLSKHFHILTALPNVFFRRLEKGGVKPARWDAQDMEALDEAGVRTFSDFTWKHVLDFFTCTECGRCVDNCPANAVGKPLSPKKITMDIRDFGYRHSGILSHGKLTANSIPGGVVQDEAFWACTTCGACEEECPTFIEHIDKIIELRRRRVLMESEFPPEIAQMYRNIEIFGDAWGMGPELRMDWARGLNLQTVRENPDIDVLFWVGCAASLDARARQTAVAFAKVLKAAEVKFGILGLEEPCCGDTARRTGNEYLFEMQARKTIRVLYGYGIRKIVVCCPHGYNALKHEYPRYGGHFEVVHSTDFIMSLLSENRLNFKAGAQTHVVWHDPCYLGRHNGIYDAPRKAFSLIPGITVVEADKSGDRSLCCGAGGGQFWMESTGPRVNDLRVEQLLEKNPGCVATGCPYCLIMLEDGLESKQMKGNIPVKDFVEIVAEALA